MKTSNKNWVSFLFSVKKKKKKSNKVQGMVDEEPKYFKYYLVVCVILVTGSVRYQQINKKWDNGPYNFRQTKCNEFLRTILRANYSQD